MENKKVDLQIEELEERIAPGLALTVTPPAVAPFGNPAVDLAPPPGGATVNAAAGTALGAGRIFRIRRW